MWQLSGGAGLGIIGLVQAGRAKAAALRANQIADKANSIANEANDLVAIANNVIHQQAERDTERSDVAWEWRWDDTATSDYVIVQNIGKDVAVEAVAQFFFEGSVEANHPIDVEGRGEIRLKILALADRRQFAADAERSSVEWPGCAYA